MNTSIKYLLIIFLLMFSGVSANGCRCEEPDSIQESFKYADLVIYGEVISIDRVTPANTINQQNSGKASLQTYSTLYKPEDYLSAPSVLMAKIRIIKGFKVPANPQTVTIFTPVSGAACGYRDFVIGKRFVVYAYHKSFYLETMFSNYNSTDNLELDNTYWTNQCSRTTDYPNSEMKVLTEFSLQNR